MTRTTSSTRDIRDARMVRVIRLPNGRDVRLATYVAAWKRLLVLDDEMPDTPVRGFGDWPMPAADVLRDLRAALDDRINRHAPGYGVGRKWHHDWQRAASQTARAVNTPRLIVRWAPTDLRARLAHRLATGSDL
jgi:hypothetical protein